MKKVTLGCPEISPQGGHRHTYIEIPCDEEQSPESQVSTPDALLLEIKFKGSITIQGYRLVTEEPDGSIAQEFLLAPDAAYELFLILAQIDKS
jgi:hypothetical protein